MDPYAWVHFLVLVLLAPVLLLCGTAAQLIRLPLITGYVLGGIIVGPYCLGILNTDALQALVVVWFIPTCSTSLLKEVPHPP